MGVGGGGWASGPVGLFCIHICIGRTACELVMVVHCLSPCYKKSLIG